ncbi:copper resistance CopC family protein [Actinocrispum wychmicini]|nr:copper resistance CopC family protein [Actinocrispum wychmicini]
MLVRRLTIPLLLAGTALFAVAGPASAHADLKSSDPAQGATLQAAPQQIKLTFSEAVDVPADAIAVTGPDGSKWTVGQVAKAGAVLTAPVTPTGPAGQYTVTYKVTADDGDTVTGKIAFTLATAASTPTTTTSTTTSSTPPPSSSSAAPASEQPVPAAQSNSGDSGGVPVWIWIVGAVVLLAIGVGVGLKFRRT